MGAIICPGCIEMCGEENCFIDTSFNGREGRNEDEDSSKKGTTEEKGTPEEKGTTEETPANVTSSLNVNRTSKSFSSKEIPDTKVGVKDELKCDGGGGGGGFFDQFFDYFDD